MENINIQSFSINSTPKILHTLPSLFKAKIIRRPSLTIKSPYVATIILINEGTNLFKNLNLYKV